MGQGASVWLLTRLVILFFYLVLDVFSTTLHMRFGLSNLLVIGMFHYICNQPLDLTTFFITCMVGKGWLHIMLCEMFLRPL